MELQPEDLEALRAQLAQGHIERAYSAIVGYMSRLRARYATGEWSVSGLYQGQFDMTYFALFPPSLKSRDLKLAVVFDYTAFRFEVWLAARNRAVQRRYWELFKGGGWTDFRLVEPAVGVDAIVASVVADGASLIDPESLTIELETAVLALLAVLEDFFSVNAPQP
jgi:hypothetical protein